MKQTKGQPRSPEELLRDREKLKELMASPELQQLAKLLESQSGGTLSSAAAQAQDGDTKALEQLLRGLAGTREGAIALERMRKKLGR